MRLIDADATIKYLREFRCKDCYKRKGMKNGEIRFCYEIGDVPCRACDIADTIDYFLDESISPTVDAIPVVRCKDCTIRHTKNCVVEMYNRKVLQSEGVYLVGDDDWFCASGKRKDGENNVSFSD